MKRLLLLGGEFRFDGGAILINFGMVIVSDASLELRRVTNETASERDPCRRDALCSRKIRGWEATRLADSRRRLQAPKSVGPVSVAIGVFAGKPADEVAVKKIKPKKRTTE